MLQTRVPITARLWLLLAVLLLGPAAATHGATLEATLDRDSITLGETAVLRIRIPGANAQSPPRIPEVNGLDFAPSGNGMSVSFENGRQTVVNELIYAVNASRTGDFTIGPIAVAVGNQILRADPVKLTVLARNDPRATRNDGLNQAAFLRLVTPDRPVHIGESFPVEIHLYAIGGRLQQAPQLAAEGFTLGPLQEGGQQGNIRINNRVYNRLRFLQTVTAARPGDLALQAANCILDVPVTRRDALGGPFDDIFGLRETKRLTLASDPATLKVLPLPGEGVPQGFNGAVGDFQLAVSASPTNVVAGDPITVRIEVRGRGNFDSVQIPEQPAWRGFRLYPPTAEFTGDDPSGLSGHKRFEQVATPESADLTALPAFVFSFFHPESRTYKTLRAPAIPIKVAAGAAMPDLPAAPETSGTTSPAAGDLRPLKPHLGSVITPPALWAGRPWFPVVTLTPPALWALARLLRAWSARRTADMAFRRRADLERRIARGLASLPALARQPSPDAFFATLFRTLQEAVALLTGEAPASITEGSLDASLPQLGAPAETVDALHRLFQACNQARYARAGSSADLDALRSEAETVCAGLNQLRANTRTRPAAPAP